MNNHVIIFFCFNNIEHIKISFDSMYLTDVDYIIVENKSNFSNEIQEYFLSKKQYCNNIIKYIQFQKNIAANAINIFLRNYGNLLRQYDYITITDGDYYVFDIKSTINEILMAFNYSDCAISSADLYLGNQLINPNKIVGTEHYDNFMKDRMNVQLNNVVGIGIPSLMTLQKKDLHILENIYFLDGNIRNRVNELNKKWYITVKNLTYCLTCDISYKGHPYFDWKQSVGHSIWHVTEEVNYIELIK